MATSLWRHSKAPVQVMLAKARTDAHELKSRVGELSAFENTVMIDTDVYVNGNLDGLFRIAESGKLGMYCEKNGGPWNSGVMAFNRELGERLSREWVERRNQVLGRYGSGIGINSYFRGDQKSLNEIVLRFPLQNIGCEYNYIIPERSLEDEARDWPGVRIFHFLHRACPHREHSRSFRLWREL